jgi:hypothetical protein
MSREQITQALEAIQKILEILYNDEGWNAIANDERADPELATDMGDALHYVSEILSKI